MEEKVQSPSEMPTTSVEVPEYLSGDLQAIEALWKQNRQKKDIIQAFLFKLFSKMCNSCYSYALDLMFYASDFRRAKPSCLAYTIMYTFGQWANEYPISEDLTLELKTKALYTVIQQKNGSLVQLVCKIFKLEDHSEYFKDIIEELILQQKFNEACFCAVVLNLQEDFPIEKIVLPLVMQDKVNLAEMYIKNHPAIQLKLVRYLDFLCGKPNEVQELISDLRIGGIRFDKLKPRPLYKLISRLIKLYKIPPEECPNLCQVRSNGALKYLMYRRFSEQSITQDCWEELVLAAVEGKPELQKELIIELISISEDKTALKMAKILGIPPNEWPKSLHQTEENERKSAPDSTALIKEGQLPSEEWDLEFEKESKNITYLNFRLDKTDIHLVETTDQFMDCVNIISQNYDIVGVDAEWKPSFGLSQSRLSLLQLAVWDGVYLLDFLALTECLQDHHWSMLTNCIFSNQHLLKLGYGIDADLQMLTQSYTGLQIKMDKFLYVLDIGVFFKKFRKSHPEIMLKLPDSTPCGKDTKGLSELSKIILGRPLDKSEQFSDWERRPLRDTQIVYAALDAFCLLQIYETLHAKTQELELNLDMLIKESLVPTSKIKASKSSAGSKKKQKQPKGIPVLGRHPPLAVGDFKVVVDNMLQGLGKALRICGADVSILENSDDHKEAIKVAQAEDRIILTSGAPFNQLKCYMPEGMCANVPESMTAKEQAAFVFQLYNVQITEADIFSRCSVCNGNHYLHIPSKEMKSMWMKFHSQVQGNYMESAKDSPPSQYIRCNGGFINAETAVMNTGVPIQLNTLLPNVFSRIEMFMVCGKCGKVYWEGSHFVRVKKNISQLMINTEEPVENIYQKYLRDETQTIALKESSEEEMDVAKGEEMDSQERRQAEKMHHLADQEAASSLNRSSYSTEMLQKQRTASNLDFSSADSDDDDLVCW